MFGHVFRSPSKTRDTRTLADTGTVVIGSDAVFFQIVRSRKRKRTIAFKVEPNATLRVSAPLSTHVKTVARVLQKRASWIARELKIRRKAHLEHTFQDGASILYLGRSYKIEVTQGVMAAASCHLRPHAFRIHVPDSNLSPESVRAEVELEIVLWLKKRARLKLKTRLDLWANKQGVQYKKLLVTGPAQRWGSCSADNIIRLNWRLMFLPMRVIDYVVAHELSHVRHKNHSASFWAFLEKTLPTYRERRQELRRFERNLPL